MQKHRRHILLLAVSIVHAGHVATAGETGETAAQFVPKLSPRTGVLAGKEEAFRTYCLTGEGVNSFAKIRADFDGNYANMPFPAEPLTYGDPEPKARDSAKADKWRATQDSCGAVTAVSEAATLIWKVTGKERYLRKAKEFLLGVCSWHFAPDWRKGSVVGATDVYYNDEAHFRLWRKLPFIYDQLRDQLSSEERAIVLAHFKERGTRSERWIKAGKVEKIGRNSLDIDAESHPVRFMAMTGLAGLALYDDLPEAREWWRFAYVFYRDQFSPWGGDDGGWAEGNAYWRGTFEHAAFQDALLAIGDPLAYSTAFWTNSPYFALYNVQPYLHTIFGDTSNAGHFNLDPSVADYMEHVSRVLRNGYFRTYADMCTDKRPRPVEKGLGTLDRIYPTACEFLVRNFIASGKPLPQARPWSELPPARYFKDVGWVAMHSALGKPDEDIQITFKSSSYGSFSHSHADQNAFILNAFGEGLAINSAYREFHRSPFHQKWTWQTKSKNAVLIDGLGQKAQDKRATGKITRFETGPRYVWTTGDATEAYRRGQSDPDKVLRVTRDLVFVDQRYVILRDRVVLNTPGKLSWLLHAEKKLDWDARNSRALVSGERATLTAQVLATNIGWRGAVTDEFPVPLDAKYVSGEVGSNYVTAKWEKQAHLTLESENAAKEFTIFSVLWPERGADSKPELHATLDENGVVAIQRPDGKTDRIILTDEAFRFGG